MSVSMEVVQGMMAEMQKQHAGNLATLARQQLDALQLLVQGTKTTAGMTDTRGIGRLVSFKGDEGKYGEWKAKLLGVLACRCPELRLVDPMVWAAADSDLGIRHRR